MGVNVGPASFEETLFRTSVIELAILSYEIVRSDISIEMSGID
jgi:hypothetical protein